MENSPRNEEPTVPAPEGNDPLTEPPRFVEVEDEEAELAEDTIADIDEETVLDELLAKARHDNEIARKQSELRALQDSSAILRRRHNVGATPAANQRTPDESEYAPSITSSSSPARLPNFHHGLKLSKPETFEGKSIVEYQKFIATLQRHFLINEAPGTKMPDRQKILYASDFLGKQPAQRWNNKGDIDVTMDIGWPAFKDFLMSCVADPVNLALATQLRYAKAQQMAGQTVADFGTYFNSLVTQMPTTVEELHLMAFYNKLIPEIRKALSLQGVLPKTYDELVTAASRVEQSMGTARDTNANSKERKRKTNEESKGHANTVKKPRFAENTPKDKDNRNTCYNCGGKGHWAGECTSTRKDQVATVGTDGSNQGKDEASSKDLRSTRGRGYYRGGTSGRGKDFLGVPAKCDGAYELELLVTDDTGREMTTTDVFYAFDRTEKVLLLSRHWKHKYGVVQDAQRHHWRFGYGTYKFSLSDANEFLEESEGRAMIAVIATVEGAPKVVSLAAPIPSELSDYQDVFDSEHMDKPLDKAVHSIPLEEVISLLEDDGRWHPMAFWSRKMIPAETRYATFDQELLAIAKTFKEWRRYLEGAQHTIELLTDHNNLVGLQRVERLTRRQAEYMSILSAYDFEMKHQAGTKNPADGPSRRPDYHDGADSTFVDEFLPTMQRKLRDAGARNEHGTDMTVATIAISDASETAKDSIRPEYQVPTASIRAITRAATRAEDPYEDASTDAVSLIRHVQKTSRAKTLVKGSKDYTLDSTDVLYKSKLYVPEDASLRQQLLEIHHDDPLAGHFGVRRTTELLRRKFCWPNIESDVKDYISSCAACQGNTARRHKPYGTLKALPIPVKPWQEINQRCKGT
nr:transposon tf2-9 polyprotein [Quercus suber]